MNNVDATLELVREKKEVGMQLVLREHDVRRAITLTAPSVDKTGGRPVLEGVHVRVEGDKAVFEASDGFMMSEVKISLDEETDEQSADFDHIFSGRELRALRTKFRKRYFDRVLINADGLHVNGAMHEVASIEGSFPDTKKFTSIGDGDGRVLAAKVNAEALVAAAKAAVAMKLSMVRLVPTPRSLVFYGWTIINDGTRVDFTTAIANDIEGDDACASWIAVNPKYLADLAGAFMSVDRDATLELHWGGEEGKSGDPIVLKGDLVTENVMLLMPMYVGDGGIGRSAAMEDFWRRRFAEIDKDKKEGAE